MAAPVNYSGVTYDDAFYRQDQESMYDYMKRLAAQRAGGVLGGGGMLNTPTEEITSTDLGTVKENCAAGYVWNGKACVPVQSGGGGDDGNQLPQVSNEERIKGIRGLLENPDKRMLLQAALPFGMGALLSEHMLEGALRNDQNEATKSQGFLDYVMGKDGDVIDGTIKPSLWDRTFGDPLNNIPKGYEFNAATERYVPTSGSGSLVGSPTSITRGMFPEIFNVAEFTNDRNTVMSHTLDSLNSGSISGGDSGYYTDTSGNSYTGGSDYGGWTGVTASGDGNDWDSFDGDDTY